VELIFKKTKQRRKGGDEMVKWIGFALIGLVVLFGLMFVLGIVELEFFKFFGPRKENVRREIFENTKSYTHGVQQDLGKYFDEYQKAKTSEDKDAITAVIKVRFAEFDANKIKSVPLRQFLVNTRGY
jgi:hypothetical protein